MGILEGDIDVLAIPDARHGLLVGAVDGPIREQLEAGVGMHLGLDGSVCGPAGKPADDLGDHFLSRLEPLGLLEGQPVRQVLPVFTFELLVDHDLRVVFAVQLDRVYQPREGLLELPVIMVEDQVLHDREGRLLERDGLGTPQHGHNAADRDECCVCRVEGLEELLADRLGVLAGEGLARVLQDPLGGWRDHVEHQTDLRGQRVQAPEFFRASNGCHVAFLSAGDCLLLTFDLSGHRISLMKVI